VQGCDISEEMIAYAKHRYPEYEGCNLSFFHLSNPDFDHEGKVADVDVMTSWYSKY
jgi:hypothetical protein